MNPFLRFNTPISLGSLRKVPIQRRDYSSIECALKVRCNRKTLDLFSRVESASLQRIQHEENWRSNIRENIFRRGSRSVNCGGTTDAYRWKRNPAIITVSLQTFDAITRRRYERLTRRSLLLPA